MCLVRFVVSCFLSYFGCLILFDSVYLSYLYCYCESMLISTKTLSLYFHDRYLQYVLRFRYFGCLHLGNVHDEFLLNQLVHFSGQLAK